MASTYMNDFRQRRYSERDAAISSEKSACEQEVKQLKSRIEPPEDFVVYLLPALIVGGICSIVFCFVIGFPFGLLLGLAIGVAIDIVPMRIWNHKNEIKTAKIIAAAEDRNSKCKERCQMLNRTCDNAIAMEEKNYRARVSKARKTYGGSTVINPIINWVVDDFQVKIRSANREAYITTITAEIFYRVEETQLVLLSSMPHSSSHSIVSKYDYFKNRFYNLPDFFDRIGFAQALAKHVEFEILRRFPEDPIAPAKGFKPKIEIDYDDEFMHMTYKVQNPNYRSAVNMRTGIGS